MVALTVGCTLTQGVECAKGVEDFCSRVQAIEAWGGVEGGWSIVEYHEINEEWLQCAGVHCGLHVCVSGR